MVGLAVGSVVVGDSIGAAVGTRVGVTVGTEVVGTAVVGGADESEGAADGNQVPEAQSISVAPAWYNDIGQPQL